MSEPKLMPTIDLDKLLEPDSTGAVTYRVFEKKESGEGEAGQEANKLSVHLQHCNFGEHAGSCKYGDENCPALTNEWEWFGWNLQQLKRCDDCHTMMNPIGKGIFECWKCVWENAGKKMENANARIAELEGQLKMADARNALLFKEKADAIALITELEARLKEAEERIKTLEAANTSWKHYHDAGSAAYERAEKAEADAGRLRGALEQVEYHQAYTFSCPWCFSLQEDGHKPDCARQSALEGGKVE